MNFGRYELLTRLGRGGMGETWKARVVGAAGVSRLVVIKRVLANMATDERFTKAFIDEARITSTLNHGNIAQVVEFGEVNGEYFLAIEYVQGKTLELALAQSSALGHPRLPIAVACFIACELLEALDYAHTRTDESGQPLGIVHRDISPDNVLLGLDGQVKVVDFGVAKAKLQGRPVTEPGTLKGKWNFFSPEQARAEDVDARSDLFAVGIVLYRMLTGRLPFDGQMHQALFQIINGVFPPPAEVAADLPEALSKILLTALKGNRDERYQSAHQMELELRAFMGQAGITASAGTLREFLKELFNGEDPLADQRPTLDGPIQPTATPHPSAPNPAAHEPTVVRSPSTRETVVDRLPMSPGAPQPELASPTEPSGPPAAVAAAVVSLPPPPLVSAPPVPVAAPVHYPGPRETATREGFYRPPSTQRPGVARPAERAATPAPLNNLWLELGLVLAIAAALGGALIWWLSQQSQAQKAESRPGVPAEAEVKSEPTRQLFSDALPEETPGGRTVALDLSRHNLAAGMKWWLSAKGAGRLDARFSGRSVPLFVFGKSALVPTSRTGWALQGGEGDAVAASGFVQASAFEFRPFETSVPAWNARVAVGSGALEVPVQIFSADSGGFVSVKWSKPPAHARFAFGTQDTLREGVVACRGFGSGARTVAQRFKGVTAASFAAPVECAVAAVDDPAATGTLGVVVTAD